MLTLFTTPVIYLYLDRLRKYFDLPQADYQHRPGFLVPGGLRRAAIDDARRWTIGGSCGSVLLGVHDRPEVPAARGARRRLP